MTRSFPAPSGPALLLLLAMAGPTGAGTEPVSLGASGAQGSDGSGGGSCSADGRFVAFESLATDLVPGVVLGGHVYRRDRLAGTTVILDVSPSGKVGNAPALRPAISADGDHVAFESPAGNLQPGDFNLLTDVFVRDIGAGTTERVSVGLGGADPDGPSSHASLSADGRLVVFESSATNLVPGDVNGTADVFLRDRLAGTTTLLTLTPGGQQSQGDGRSPRITPDGRHVAWLAGNLDVVGLSGPAYLRAVVRDLETGTTVLASVSAEGVPSNAGCSLPALSDDGQVVAFASGASNLVPGDTNFQLDVFVRDLANGTTEILTVELDNGFADESSGLSTQPVAISGDGRLVAFDSDGQALVPGDTGWRDIFVYDRMAHALQRVSVTSAGAPAEGNSVDVALSGDGRVVLFTSEATNLAAPDANGALTDVFAHDLQVSGWTWLPGGLPGSAGIPRLSASGGIDAGDAGELLLSAVSPASPVLLLAAVEAVGAPFKGGTLAAFPALLVMPLVSDAQGLVLAAYLWPTGVPAGITLVLQAIAADPGAPPGLSLSNPITGTTP